MRRLLVALVLSLAATSLGFAQSSTDGTLRGQIKDEQGGVLPGATVTVRSPTVAGIFTGVTDTEGLYRIINLPPGDYVLTAELPGFSRFSRSNIVMRAGLNLTIDLTLRVGSIAQTVEVSGETPMLETAKTTQAVNISGEFQRQLPLGSRRDYSEFLELTPGVTARSFDQATGGQVYMLRGSEIENHVVQFDGADVGSFRQGWASLYVNASTDAIQDTQVKTGGADASQPLGVGVVINLATQSGTNELRGAASTIYQARRWNGNNNPTGTSAVYNIVQPDLSLGGPIKKDHVFFFGAYRHTRRDTGISRTEKQLNDLRGIDPNFTPFDNISRNNYYYIKGTAQTSPKHQFYTFYQRDVNPESASTPTQIRPYSVTAFGGYAVGGRWSAVWGSSLTTKVLMAWNTKSVNGSFGVFDGYMYDGPAVNVCNSVFQQQGRWSCSATLARTGGTGTISAQPAEKLTLQGDLTYYKRGWAGSHEMQVGVLLQPHLQFKNTTRYLNDQFTTENVVLREAGNPASGTIPYHRIIVDEPEAVTQHLKATDYAFYVQDAWRPAPRLTLNMGVRFDFITARDDVFDVQTQNSLDVGPRFGVSYVITEDQKNVLRFSAGRIHDLPQSFYLPGAGTNRVGQRDLYDLNLDGTFETVFVTPKVTALSTNREIDPDRHQPFTDEFILGYRRQLPTQISVDVSLVRRYYKDMPALVEVNGIYEGNVFRGYRDEALNDIFLVTNDEWTTPVYTGLEFTAAKRARTMQILATYTRQWQHLDGAWRPRDPASFIQPDHFPNDKGIGSIRGNESNSLSGTSMTRSPSWQKHVFRVGGTYTAPWNVMLATNVSFQSGPYSGPIVTRLDAADPQFGPPTVTLSNGRVVPNPLATRIRFAHNDRGEGQISTPNLIVWNVRLGRNFRLKSTQTFEIAFDIFNVTNRGAAQQFLSGGNQLYSANYAIAPDGRFRGTSLQFARSGQLLLKYAF